MLWSSDFWSNILNKGNFGGKCHFILWENAETKQLIIAFKKLNYQFD